MYKEHPALNPPPDDATLWRYMSFTKFASLIAKNGLFFVRVDHLKDPYEGSLGLPNFTENPDGFPFKARSFEWMKNIHVVNCWHENEHESEAMWSLYSNIDDGIAVRTNFRSLADSLVCESPVEISRVFYLDYEQDRIPDGFMFAPLLCKRKSFEHEREVRAFIMEIPESGPENQALPIQTPGNYYDVDVSTLVKEVVLPPFSEPWLEEVVQVTLRKFGFDFPVRKSSIGVKPYWV